MLAWLACGCIEAEVGDDGSDPWGKHQDDPVVLGGDRPADEAPDSSGEPPEAPDEEDLPRDDASEDDPPDEDPGHPDDEPPEPPEPEDEPACVPAAEVCGNGVDEDCDGTDALCPFTTVAVNGTCVWVTCPGTHPHPVACDVQFSGIDDDGCVAWAPPSSSVFFLDGDDCEDGGHAVGTVTCGLAPGSIDEDTCILRVENPWWEEEWDDC